MIEARGGASTTPSSSTPMTTAVGHDVCKLPPNRWFEGLVPTEPAFPLHPNAKGEASMARSVLEGAAASRRPPNGWTDDPTGSGSGRDRSTAGAA